MDQGTRLRETVTPFASLLRDNFIPTPQPMVTGAQSPQPLDRPMANGADAPDLTQAVGVPAPSTHSPPAPAQTPQLRRHLPALPAQPLQPAQPPQPSYHRPAQPPQPSHHFPTVPVRPHQLSMDITVPSVQGPSHDCPGPVQRQPTLELPGHVGVPPPPGVQHDYSALRRAQEQAREQVIASRKAAH